MIEHLEYTLSLPPSCPTKWDHLIIRKMHFADVEISTDANAPRVFRISINGNEFIVERNAICEEVL